MRPGIRSLLFVPANDGRKVDKAAACEVDAIVLDLEDAVAVDDKEAARDAAVAFAARFAGLQEVIVRVNGAGTTWGLADIEALRATSVDAIMLPKASVAELAVLGEPGVPVIALIETALGVEEATAIARDPRVTRIMLGSADLAADLGIALQEDELELLYPRARVAMASAAAGIEPPIDVVHLAVTDTDGLRRSASRGRDLGFSGKACIHPGQIATVNDVFSPSSAETLRARAVVTAFTSAQAEGRAVTVVDGRMIDLPVVRHAERVLAMSAPHYRKEDR